MSPRRAARYRQWALVYAALLSGGLGLLAGWALARQADRWGIRPARRWAAAALWALGWTLVRGRLWLPGFYRALAVPRASAALPLLAGWGLWALVLAALWPALQRLRPPWERMEGAELAAPGPSPAVLNPPARDPPDGVELGRDARGRPGVLTDSAANTHVLVLGATGTGKTGALLRIAASALRRGLPLVVVDGKGSADLRQQLGRAAAEAGRPLQLWSPHGPGHWNPLAHGDVTELRDKLVATEQWSEPHYRRAAERYLGVALRTLQDVGQPLTLQAVAAALHPAHLEALGRQLPQRAAADALYAYLDGLDGSGKSAVLGLGNRLATLVDSAAGPWLDPPAPAAALDLRRLVLDGGAALFSLDALRYPSLAAQLGALLLQDLKTVAGLLLDGGWRGPWYLLLDEFNVLEGRQVLALLNKGREAGLCCVLATQELADVAAAGGSALVDQVLANTNVKLLLRQDVAASAQRLAAVAGTRAGWEVSHGLRDGQPSGQGTAHPAALPLLDAGLLQRLRPFEAVLLRKSPEPALQHLRLWPPDVSARRP